MIDEALTDSNRPPTLPALGAPDVDYSADTGFLHAKQQGHRFDFDIGGDNGSQLTHNSEREFFYASMFNRQ